MLTLNSTVTLNDGIEIPLLGFGAFKLGDGAECERAVGAALEAGYRHIDTAAVYRNEESCGRALRASGIPREEIFVTTKLWISDFGRDSARAACEASLVRLGLDYADLYLIHWPVDDTMMAAWETMQALRAEGKCRSIGVSNFSRRRFEKAFFPHTAEVPSVNQVEWHPFCFDRDLLNYCNGKGIRLEAWGPLTRAQRLDDPVLQSVARNTGKTTAQVLLRWQLQHGVITIPKSSHPDRIRANADLYDFAISAEDMARLDGLAEGYCLSDWRPCPPGEWY